MDRYEDYFFRVERFVKSGDFGWVRLLARIGTLTQRGVLTVLEVAGAMLLIRALVAPTFIATAALIGAGLLVVGAIFEYLIWLKLAAVLYPTNSDETASLRRERDALRARIQDLAPHGAFRPEGPSA